MNEYNQVSPEIVDKLIKVCGQNNVIYDRDLLGHYACDEGNKHFCHTPEVVVKPQNSDQVSKIMKIANEHIIPVTPRGAGSGIAGAAIPIYGGILLSTEKMNKILEIDTINRIAVVEPGVVTNELCKKVLEKGLFYAGYPMSVGASFIGGNVATNAGGGKVIKYGNTRKHILGLEVVLATGEILNIGGKFRKSTWGYDLLDLMIGSEGTLGIFTKIIVNLIPPPSKTADILAPFKTIDEAIHAFASSIVSSKSIPISVEFMDKISVMATTEYLNTTLPLQDRAEAFLLITIEGRTKEELEILYEKIGTTLLHTGALDVFIADNKANSEKIWSVRREVLEGLKFKDPYVCAGGDVVVPVSEIPKLVDMIRDISKAYNVTITIVGHIGDGNLHPALFKPNNVEVERWAELSEEILSEIVNAAVKLGGVGSGEHGIGIEKKPLFLQSKSQTEIRLMRGIKRLFDPNWILNPGKIL